jgi:hypothetical protein
VFAHETIHSTGRAVRRRVPFVLALAFAFFAFGVVVSLVAASPAAAGRCADCDPGGGGGTPPPPPPPPPPAPAPGTRDVSVKLVSVRANNIEDVCCFGLARDGFYLLGKLTIGENQRTIVTMPRDVGEGQTLPYNETLIAVNVPDNAAIHLSLDAFDKDAGKVFEHLPVVVSTIGSVCELVAPFDPTGIAAGCAAAIPVATPIANLLSQVNDPDDRLGMIGYDWSVQSLPVGTSRSTWHFEGDQSGWIPGWSDWSYDVTYEITIR